MDHLRLWLCCLSLLQLYALYAFKFQPSHSTSTKSKFSSSPLRSAHYMGDNNASGDERGDADGKTGGSWEKDQRRKAWEHVHREREVKSMKEMEIFRMQKKLLSTLGVGTAGLGTIGYRPPIADALDRPIDDKLYHKAIINVQSDDFWYPPYLIGKWNTTLTFDKAIFTEKYSLEELSRDENLPGFTKYSVLFAPDMGKDVNMVRRFAQIDSHPREDHPYNLREIFRAYLGEGATIDSAKYYFQKAPDWFHSPANKWKVTYHDSTGRGEMNLLTQKRNIEVLAGSVETSEFIKQEHIRYDDDNFGRDNFGRGKIVRSDYCLHWKLGEYEVDVIHKSLFISCFHLFHV